MTGYLFLLADAPGDWERMDAEEREGVYEAHGAFHAFVKEHGRLVADAALADADAATTVRAGTSRAAERVVTDGPFAETVEVLVGYYEVELPDLDAAIAAARLLPHQYTVEIRPTVEIDEA